MAMILIKKEFTPYSASNVVAIGGTLTVLMPMTVFKSPYTTTITHRYFYSTKSLEAESDQPVSMTIQIVYYYYYNKQQMARLRSITQESSFTQYTGEKHIRQTKLPEDGESSFSSLDSNIAKDMLLEPKKRYRSNRYDYSDSYKDNHTRAKLNTNYRQADDRVVEPILRQLQLDNKRLYEQTIASTRLNEQLQVQNQVYRKQLEIFKQNNVQLESDLINANQQIRRLRDDVGMASSKFNQTILHQQRLADRELTDKLRNTEKILRQLEVEKTANHNKLISEKSKVVTLERQITHLRQKIASFERQLHDINSKEDELRLQYQEIQQKNVQKILELQNQIQKYQIGEPAFKNERWKDNFVKVFIDMMAKVSKKQQIQLKDTYSDKRKTKLGWKLLKQLVFKHYQ